MICTRSSASICVPGGKVPSTNHRLLDTGSLNDAGNLTGRSIAGLQ
jgi:hypothetical protein